MNEIILLKLGELVLKGLNRRTFEDRLVANARRRLQAHGKFKVYTKQSTMYVEPQSEDCDLDGAWEAMTKLFGVVGLSRARACAKDKDAMLQTAVEYLGDRLAAAKTFKVESKRADKSFPMTSIQLSQYVGGELDEKYPNLTVDVHHPELTVYLEVRDYAAYVHADPEPGAGGLPVGVGGRAVSLLSGGIDSPVASWMIAKRGIALEMVHFFSYPYTSEEAPGPSSPASAWARWPARPWRPCGPPLPSPPCPSCGRWWAWTRRRLSASPGRSTPLRPPSCPMRTAAPSSLPAIPGCAPCWGSWRPPRPRWTWRAW